jgi:hypothetical protein
MCNLLTFLNFSRLRFFSRFSHLMIQFRNVYLKERQFAFHTLITLSNDFSYISIWVAFPIHSWQSDVNSRIHNFLQWYNLAYPAVTQVPKSTDHSVFYVSTI